MHQLTVNNVPITICSCAYKQEDSIFMFPVYGSFCVVDLLVFKMVPTVLGNTVLKKPEFFTDLAKHALDNVDKLKICFEYFMEQVRSTELPTILERSKHNRSLINLVGQKVSNNKIPYQCTGQYYTDEQKIKYNVPKFSIHKWTDSCTGRQYMPEYLFDKKCRVTEYSGTPLWYKTKLKDEMQEIRDKFGGRDFQDALVFIRDSWQKCGRVTKPENLFLTDEQAEELENFINS